MDDSDRWFGVELRHLAAVTAVSREGSFRKAADSLGYVQSAVSQQIAQLEGLVGSRLIDRARGSKQITLTPLGELLVEHAEVILARVHAARADLVSFADESPERRVRLGVFPGVGPQLLPSVLRAASAGARDLRLDLVESGTSSEIFALVERGEVDLAFAELPLPAGPFQSRTIVHDPCVLLVAAGSEWAARTPPPTVEELAQMPLIALDGVSTTETLGPWFAAHGLTPDFVHSTASESTLRALVAGHVGAAVVPRLAVETLDPGVVAVDLAGLVPDRRIALCWHADRLYSREIDALCEGTIRVGRELTEHAAPLGRAAPAELTAA